MPGILQTRGTGDESPSWYKLFPISRAGVDLLLFYTKKLTKTQIRLPQALPDSMSSARRPKNCIVGGETCNSNKGIQYKSPGPDSQ